MAEIPTRLFHAIYPAPECCRFQMKCLGNLCTNYVAYRCSGCLKELRITATFEEDAEIKADQEALSEMDDQE